MVDAKPNADGRLGSDDAMLLVWIDVAARFFRRVVVGRSLAKRNTGTERFDAWITCQLRRGL